jgi:hypothetical protein
MKRIRKILIGIGFLAYAFIVIFTNMEKTETVHFNEDSVNIVLKNEIINSLESKYHSRILTKSSAGFTDGYIKKLLTSIAIIDSLQTEIVKKAGESYIYVEAKSDNGGRIFARLKCDDSIADKVENKRYAGALLAARIFSVDKINVQGEVKIDDGVSLIDLGNDIVLKGECLEYIELSNS